MIIATHTPEGKKLVRFHKTKTHQSYRLKDGSEVPGVSTVLKILNKGEGLMHWAWDLGRKGEDYRKVRDNSADIGSLAHFMVECELRGEVADLSEFSPADQEKAANCFKLAMGYIERERFTNIGQEVQLVSEQHGYGGTLDAPCLDRDGKYVLLDWKTSKSIYDEYLLQVSAYRELWNENHPDKQITRSIIVRIGKNGDGDFETREVFNHDKQFDAFKAILGAHKALSAIRRN